MTPPQPPKLHNLIKGLNSDQKQLLADEMGVSRAHLVKKSHHPGKFTVDQAARINAFLENIYGEGSIENCFEIISKPLAKKS